MKDLVKKVLESLLRIIPLIIIFMSMLSAIAIFMIAMEGFNLSFDFSPNGFQNYLKLFEPYSTLFSATLALILAQEAFKRLRLMEEANRNTFRASNRTLWIQTVKDYYGEIKTVDPGVVNVVAKNVLNIHDYFFDKDYKFENEEELRKMFDKFFSDHVGYMENMNIRLQSIGCYGSEDQSYSWEGFRLLVSVMIGDEGYPNFWNNLRMLYQKRVVDFIKLHQHHVDAETYRAAIERHRLNLEI